MTRLPPLDSHAHIAVSIPVSAVDRLSGVIFVATRSLSEAEEALLREDSTLVWGVGCHPALPEAHADFTGPRFAELLGRTAFAGELGLDGGTRVLSETQVSTFRTALGVLRGIPRIVSLHSYKATGELLDELRRQPIHRPILHWWLGNERQTQLAIDLGCYFSINSMNIRRGEVMDQIPLDRVLIETDHPFGDRAGAPPHAPGIVEHVELQLASRYAVSQDEIRRTVWRNLADLVRELGCGELLPKRVRSTLASIPLSRLST